MEGRGRGKRVETAARERLRRRGRSAATAPGKEVVLRAAHVMVRWREAHLDEIRNALSRRGVMRYRIEAHSDSRRESFSEETSG